MNEATIVQKFPGWNKTERLAYSGVQVRLLQATDWKGNHLALVLSGPLRGEMRWFSDKEIVRQEAAE